MHGLMQKKMTTPIVPGHMFDRVVTLSSGSFLTRATRPVWETSTVKTSIADPLVQVLTCMGKLNEVPKMEVILLGKIYAC